MKGIIAETVGRLVKRKGLIQEATDRILARTVYARSPLHEHFVQTVYMKHHLLVYQYLEQAFFKPALKEWKQGVYESGVDGICQAIDEATWRPTVWTCWMQGLHAAPPIVQLCVETIREVLGEKKGWEVVVVTEENYAEYISLPDDILVKYKRGIIDRTKFSNIIRMNLLAKHGGLWIDSTVLCAGVDSVSLFEDSDLFVFSKWCFFNGEIMTHDNWFIYARPGNDLILKCLDLHYRYWRKHDYVIDYFLYHIFWSLLMHEYPDKWNDIPFISVHPSEYLQTKLSSTYDRNELRSLIRGADFHKLGWKSDFGYETSSNSIIRFMLDNRDELREVIGYVR